MYTKSLIYWVFCRTYPASRISSWRREPPSWLLRHLFFFSLMTSWGVVLWMMSIIHHFKTHYLKRLLTISAILLSHVAPQNIHSIKFTFFIPSHLLWQMTNVKPHCRINNLTCQWKQKHHLSENGGQIKPMFNDSQKIWSENTFLSHTSCVRVSLPAFARTVLKVLNYKILRTMLHRTWYNMRTKKSA